jgi:RIO kinase 1
MAKDAFEDDDLSKGDEYIKGSFSSSWRPNAHGGHHSYSSVLQRLSNRYHNFTSQTRASPLEVSFIQIHSLFNQLFFILCGYSFKLIQLLLSQEWEGGLNIAMSNTVTTAIRSSVRGMAIGKTRTNDKADRATVENVNK